MDYHGLSWIMDYHRLSRITGASYGLWTIMDQWIIVAHCGFLDMHHHEIAWITVYARQASDDT